MAFDLRQLRYAVASADHRSFRRAAQSLGVDSSTFSRRIRDMELRLGIVIFERSRIGVRPTPPGAEFLRRARRVLAETETMTNDAKAIGRGEAGSFSVGFYTSLSAGNLRAALVAFHQRYPEVDIRIMEGARERLYCGLDTGELDVVIATGDAAMHGGGAMMLWAERIFVALPESHRLANNEVVYWTDLKGETFLLAQHDPSPDIHDLLVAKLASPGDRPKVVQHNVSRETIKNLVGAGFGVSLLCEACIGAQYAGVVYREARDGTGPAHVSYVAHWDRENANPALKRFLALLEERHALRSDGG